MKRAREESAEAQIPLATYKFAPLWKRLLQNLQCAGVLVPTRAGDLEPQMEFCKFTLDLKPMLHGGKHVLDWAKVRDALAPFDQDARLANRTRQYQDALKRVGLYDPQERCTQLITPARDIDSRLSALEHQLNEIVALLRARLPPPPLIIPTDDDDLPADFWETI